MLSSLELVAPHSNKQTAECQPLSQPGSQRERRQGRHHEIVAFAGLGRGVPIKWTKVSEPRTSFVYESMRSASPGIPNAPGGSFFSDPDRTNAFAWWPRLASNGINRLPM
jgi:hypothetical protein